MAEFRKSLTTIFGFCLLRRPRLSKGPSHLDFHSKTQSPGGENVSTRSRQACRADFSRRRRAVAPRQLAYVRIWGAFQRLTQPAKSDSLPRVQFLTGHEDRLQGRVLGAMS